MAKYRPLSWFSDWAGKLGWPVWVVYVVAGLSAVGAWSLVRLLLGGQGYY